MLYLVLKDCFLITKYRKRKWGEKMKKKKENFLKRAVVVFIIVTALVSFSGKVHGAILVSSGFWPDTPEEKQLGDYYAAETVSDRGLYGIVIQPFDFFDQGYSFFNIVIGEENYYKELDAGRGSWGDRIYYYEDDYYKLLDEGVCYWWLDDSQFWNAVSFDINQFRGVSRGYGFAVLMREQEYYPWIDKRYYWALNQGLFYLGQWYVIPEPSTLGLLLFGAFVLRKRNRYKS